MYVYKERRELSMCYECEKPCEGSGSGEPKRRWTNKGVGVVIWRDAPLKVGKKGCAEEGSATEQSACTRTG